MTVFRGHEISRIMLILSLLFLPGLAVTNAPDTAIDKLLSRVADATGKDKAALLVNLTDTYIDRGELASALRTAEKALSVADEFGDQPSKLASLRNRGYVYSAEGNFPLAARDYRMALQLAGELGALRDQAVSNLMLGGAYGELGDNHKAVAHYFTALDEFEQLNDREGVAGALNNIAVAYDNMGNPEKEMEYLEKTLALSREIDDKTGIALALSNMGQVYRERREYEKALQHLQEALEITRATGEWAKVVYCLNQIAWVYHDQQQYRDAAPYVEQSLEISQARGLKKDQFKSLMLSARLQLGLGNSVSATEYVSEATRLAEDLKMDLEYTETLEVRASIQEQKKDFEQALKTHQRYLQRIRRELADENDSLTLELQARFDTERKENEIRLLKQEAELQEAKLQEHEATRQALVTIILLVLLAAGFLLMLYRTKHKASAIIAKKNAALSDAFKKMEELARTDPLTGLLNRRALVELIEYEAQRQLRSEKPMVFIIADIDHFKQLNDTFGHECGDQVLQSVADFFRSSFRQQDTVCRWGGEEFLIMLPETGLEDAETLAHKLRRAITELEHPCDGAGLHLTMTFGVARCDPEADPVECINRADQALYRGKKAGRDQVISSAV